MRLLRILFPRIARSRVNDKWPIRPIDSVRLTRLPPVECMHIAGPVEAGTCIDRGL